MSISDSTQPVIVGEVLFDCFPDGTTVLGGAPFNVAWHLQGFGLSPLMISGVGNDKHGKMVLENMRKWGMDTHGIHKNDKHPTGKVTVSLENGQPSYDIRAEQAYDFIGADRVIEVLGEKDYSLLYHGSLLTRTQHSRRMLDKVLEISVLPSFVDINLRAPWWQNDDVRQSLSQASWVKLNEDELLTIMEVDVDSTTGLFEYAKEMLEQFNLQLLIVTQGDKGAFCVTRDDMISGAPVSAKVVDTVGAGDAFASVSILGLTHGWPLATLLERALEFGAAICEQRGATAMNQALYDKYIKEWQI
ncbi:MAG: PfkB family carbohydrate kinase [Gammaproteobacteria bacterium]|nr:PfkB family carbohydrate kinase [Gammaproteobacteria bacterium]